MFASVNVRLNNVCPTYRLRWRFILCSLCGESRRKLRRLSELREKLLLCYQTATSWFTFFLSTSAQAHTRYARHHWVSPDSSLASKVMAAFVVNFPVTPRRGPRGLPSPRIFMVLGGMKAAFEPSPFPGLWRARRLDSADVDFRVWLASTRTFIAFAVPFMVQIYSGLANLGPGVESN